jgi:hypothetical protein
MGKRYIRLLNGPPNSFSRFTDRAGDSGVLALGWGSGTADFPYLIAVSLTIFETGFMLK